MVIGCHWDWLCFISWTGLLGCCVSFLWNIPSCQSLTLQPSKVGSPSLRDCLEDLISILQRICCHGRHGFVSTSANPFPSHTTNLVELEPQAGSIQMVLKCIENIIFYPSTWPFWSTSIPQLGQKPIRKPLGTKCELQHSSKYSFCIYMYIYIQHSKFDAPFLTRALHNIHNDIRSVRPSQTFDFVTTSVHGGQPCHSIGCMAQRVQSRHGSRSKCGNCPQSTPDTTFRNWYDLNRAHCMVIQEPNGNTWIWPTKASKTIQQITANLIGTATIATTPLKSFAQWYGLKSKESLRLWPLTVQN